MTETTQPDPQVVAWMREYFREHPNDGLLDAAVAYAGQHASNGKPISFHAETGITVNDLCAAAEAAREPLTRADIPAGQGPASLYVAPFVGGLRAVYFKAEDGRIARVTEENRMRHEMRVLWDHLAATLPHVTTEED